MKYKRLAENDNQTQRVLIGIAVILCALIMGYNVLYKPDVQIVEISELASEVSQKTATSEQTEEYIAYNANESAVVNINTAGVEELKSLKGVGEVLAQNIIDYRTQIGGFTDIEQLLEVSGIGNAKYSAIQNYVTI